MTATTVRTRADTPAADHAHAERTWKAGLSRAAITPTIPLMMSGYGGREPVAETKLHDLWVKVLALQAPDGGRGVLVTSDLCGIARRSYDAVCDAALERFGLDRSQLKLTCSHTHTGPLLRECFEDFNPLTERQRDDVYRYTERLERTIVDAIGEALGSMSPAELSAAEGLADFAVNRRNNREADVPAMRARGEPLRGPVDHTVPVLSVRSGGSLRALAFCYACHTTTLNTLQWSGDYAGFAMLALEGRHPGVQAMFYQGCGADQNPLPRRSVELCRGYGDRLAAAVDGATVRPGRRVGPSLRAAFESIEIPFDRTPGRDELEVDAARGGQKGRWAARLIRQLDEGRPLAGSCAYPIQVWRLGEQLWISLAGEVVVDYALGYRAKYGDTTWVHGYAHDMVAHVPSSRVWHEGGYEAGHAFEFGRPADRWSEDVQDRIDAAVERLVARVR